MNNELEKLIDLAFADGQITEKEKEIIFRKAQKLGEDVDEVEMIIEGRISQLLNQSGSRSTSQKEGEIKKCPACGAAVISFSAYCSDCGHEFRGVQSVKSITVLLNEIKNAEEDLAEQFKRGRFEEEYDYDEALKKRITTIISSFPIPNTKEDIIEFLTYSLGEASIKTSWFDKVDKEPNYIKKQLWISKFQQTLFKARIMFQDDKFKIEPFEDFAKKNKI